MQADITKLNQKYGIDGAKCSQLSSMTAQEITDLTGRKDIEGGGIRINYRPTAPLVEQIIRIRLENSLTDPKTGRQIRYLSLPGQPNALFIPEGMDFSQRLVLLTEGEFKALAAWQRGLPCVAVSGVWNWRMGSNWENIKLSDREALIPELRRDWTGHDFCLIYDSDIDQNHMAWTAFTKLAEQLYAFGADTVKVMSLPQIIVEVA